MVGHGVVLEIKNALDHTLVENYAKENHNHLRYLDHPNLHSLNDCRYFFFVLRFF